MKKKVETHQMIKTYLRYLRSIILNHTVQLQKNGAKDIPEFSILADFFSIDDKKAVELRLALIRKAEKCLEKYLPAKLPKRQKGFEEILRQYDVK